MAVLGTHAHHLGQLAVKINAQAQIRISDGRHLPVTAWRVEKIGQTQRQCVSRALLDSAVQWQIICRPCRDYRAVQSIQPRNQHPEAQVVALVDTHQTREAARLHLSLRDNSAVGLHWSSLAQLALLTGCRKLPRNVKLDDTSTDERGVQHQSLQGFDWRFPRSRTRSYQHVECDTWRTALPQHAAQN